MDQEAQYERAKLYPLERTVGSRKCYGKRCEVCDNVTETSIFTSTVSLFDLFLVTVSIF